MRAEEIQDRKGDHLVCPRTGAAVYRLECIVYEDNWFMLWLVECPFMWDQGLIRPMIVQGGVVVLFCDSCDTVWLTPQDIAQDKYFQPDPPEWKAGDMQILPGTTDWATKADLPALWKSLPWHEE